MNTASNRPLKVFLCHASADKPAVHNLYKYLTAAGVDVWLDQEKLLPGQNWRVEIPRAVKESDVVVICLSSKSITKEGYVQKEIQFALDIAGEKPEGTIYLIPARLEECEVPQSLESWHWVDLFAANGYDHLMRSLYLRAEKIPLSEKEFDFWDGLSDSILIVYGAKYKENDKEGHVTLSLRDLSAAQEIFNFLKRKYPTAKSIESIPAISQIPGTTFDWYTYLKPNTDLIVIGGFVANSEFDIHRGLYQRHFRLKMGRICRKEQHRVFHIETNKDKYFSRDNPSKIEDLPSSSIKTDFAFISNTKEEISDSVRRVITIAGIKGNGTLGATRFLTHKPIPEFAHKKIEGDSRVELVVKIDIANNDVIDKTRLVEAIWNDDPVYENKTHYWEPCETPNVECENCPFGEEYHS